VQVEFAGLPRDRQARRVRDARQGNRDAKIAAATRRILALRGGRWTCLDKERAIYRAQVEDAKKPANIIDKIVEGKLGSFYKQFVLPDQESVRVRR